MAARGTEEANINNGSLEISKKRLKPSDVKSRLCPSQAQRPYKTNNCNGTVTAAINRGCLRRFFHSALTN